MRVFGARRNRRRTSPKEKLVSSSRTAGRVGRFFLIVAGIGVAAAGLPLAGYHGYRQVLDSGYFGPEHIYVEGQSRVERDDIIAAAGLNQAGVNLIEYDADEAAERLEDHPWIASAEIETDLPGTVTVRVREHVLLGIVRADRFYLVDEDGGIIKPWAAEESVEGPIVSGVDPRRADAAGLNAMRQGFTIAQLYETMGLNRWAPLAEVHFDEHLGYSLFAGDTEVRLGHDRFDARLRRLWQVYGLLEERGTKAEYVLLDMEEDLDRVAIKAYPLLVEAPPPQPEQAPGSEE